MNFILWIVFGAIAGWLASIIMKTNAGSGLIVNIIVGIIGAFLGGWLFALAGGKGVTGFNLYSMFVAVVGAAILIAIVKAVRK